MSLSDADRLEIEELVYRYNHATDAGDGDTRADLFTEDGIFVAPGRDLRGRDAIRAATRASGRRHWVNNLVIDGQDGEATIHCYLTLFDVAGRRMQITGRYSDTVQLVGGAWKFARREFNVDQAPTG